MLPWSHQVFDRFVLALLCICYFAANKSIQQAAVQYILDTVVEELQLDSKRTFIYVEMAFFTRWWNQQNDATKQVVRGGACKELACTVLVKGACKKSMLVKGLYCACKLLVTGLFQLVHDCTGWLIATCVEQLESCQPLIPC